MTTPIVVDLYCRSASSGPEGRTNLEQQEIACRDYCQEHGLSVGMVHHEVTSGMIYRERKQLSLMRRRYRAGHIQGVVVTRPDRLSRSKVHLVVLMQDMEAQGVVLHCVNEDVEDTPTGKFIRLFLGFITEVEREKSLDVLAADTER